MARLVKTVQDQLVTCNVTTIYNDGSESTETIALGDVVQGLRYVENQTVKSVTGRVAKINVACDSVTQINVNKPVDYFAKDVRVSSLVIDASSLYESDVVTVNAMEIVEKEGEENVDMVRVTAIPNITLEMTYTDGRTVLQDIEVGDVICDAVIMTSPGEPDIKGDFRVVAFQYSMYNKTLSFNGVYLQPIEGGAAFVAFFDNIIRFTEKAHSEVTESTSLGQLATALEENDEVFAFFDTDVTVPLRDDGRITSLFINAGKTLTVDLNGHDLNTQAYAFYVNGGHLVIRDTGGAGKITACKPNAAYPAVFVAANGTCTMEGGTIDVSNVPLADGDYNWLYGVVCYGDGVFNMKGGKIVTGDAAGISITNGTATGAGAQFNISGDAVITSKDCTAIYLADNKSVNISDNAVINGGVLLRMGDLNVSGNAVINGFAAGSDIYPLGKLVCESGCENHNAAILAMTGCYGSDLGNDLNINITGRAKVNGYIDNAIDIAELNTRYDQKVIVNVSNASNISYVNKLWNVYGHGALSDMAREQGKTLAPETTATDLTITVDGSKVYPSLQ